MQQEMGINKLANMFMGNPQPLANKVQQDQQQAKPGQIPPDLAEAIALQKIQEMHQAAQNQQAMQAGGPQPTVMEKLRQLTGTAPQAQPGMPPQGMPQGIAAAQGMPPQGMPPQGMPQGMPPVQAAHGGSISDLVSNLGHHYDGGGIVAFATGGDEGLSERDKLRRMEAEYNPAMTAGLTGETETQPVTSQPMDQRAMLNQHIAETLGLNRDTERDKGADYFKNTVGLDALLKEMEGRTTAREARHTAAQANRVPEWIKGLQSLGGAPIRGGAGMVLGQLGRGTTAAREAYGAEDEKFADDMDRLRDIITKAKIEGNTGVANAGIAALKELDARKNAAAQTGGSLQIADENATTRKQVAADALAGRKAQFAEGAANRTANLTAAQDAHFRDLALKQANATAAKLKDPDKLLTGEDQYPTLNQEELANQFFGKYYAQLKSGKMAEAPVNGPGAPPPGAVREVKK